MSAPLRAPFPWFGGKSRVAHLVWAAFGDVQNFVEPFAGSLAVLLGRPTAPRIETVNDLDCYVANFWRATQLAPAEVARFADWPVNEIDLHARHRWLVDQAEFRERMRADPEYFDARVAGWWVWGICQWIGGGWCAESNWEPAGEKTARQAKRPSLGKGGRGVGRTAEYKRSNSGRRARGIQTARVEQPALRGDGGASGAGIHASGKPAGAVYGWMNALAERLRRVRVCCGDWTRVLGPSATTHIGVTGMFLDPPYLADFRDPSLYGTESADVAHRVREWALEHGDDPKMRIALCGYEGEHQMPKSWQCVAWKASGGYAAAAGHHENSAKERIWFSPHCAAARAQGSLFDARAL